MSEPTIAGERPLVGSSISSNSRGSTIARAIDSICFWPPDSAPARDSQNFLSAGKKPKIQARRASFSGAIARAEDEVLLDGKIGEHRHGLRGVADAKTRDVARGQAVQGRWPERDASRRGPPQAHDGAQGGRLSGAVAAEQHGRHARRRLEVDALQDMVAADMRMHAFEA